MIQRVKPRPFVVARVMLLALVAHLGLAAVCDAMCAITAERAPAQASVSVSRAHATHCQSTTAPGARARAGHHVAPCQHEGELSARASESRPSGRVDLMLVSRSPVSPPPSAGDLRRLAPDSELFPRAPRSARPLVLRI
jgi:hypothetical protein